ncbi:methylated-DNA--[protein]-cysteine S-methyltransferase [Pseudodesulfovibrio sp. zrk46]|uniref:methylated-DNA--[protein]-cysteine S-methyltransferase n=1 Tax=Pseudodesulfovibrio sp. zrk46 TaxID=2725288 RepID=UPI001449365D|nr:methylated-DNA--[protein]-cysteine S-methyltransferase [Pseudodesulfovibrio sp. zrk46]QJB57103.1 methylated-DNA--[protein]-cysteine S-methyltransferase [Pseudodesulfovibrio sp. zrk46]
MTYYTAFKTPYWEIILVGDENGITHLHMVTNEGKRDFIIKENWQRDDAMFTEARKQILEYFDGKRTQFDLPLNPQGTEFQKKAWKALRTIPFGEVRTYKEMAESIGNPNASRAVGTANAKNPIPLIIPCHRVIATGGKLAGFALGVDAKERLLRLEKAI